MKNTDTDSKMSLAQALKIIKCREGADFPLFKVNLAELERLTGITRARLRRLKANGFEEKEHGLIGTKHKTTVLTGYTSVIDNLLRQNCPNSAVCYEQLQKVGYKGGLTAVKDYIRAHKNLLPAPRHIVSPQGNRGKRYFTAPGEAFQMDWGFVDVIDECGNRNRAAVFAMICHHCGMMYVEFFPNAMQENLFIGMLHAFMYMGIPQYVLTDNMKSVVTKRDAKGNPLWNHDYEAFMKAVGFRTRLCKAYHPFTKGKVERLVQFVKGNFVAGRVFMNVTDMNEQSLLWCSRQNGTYHKAADCIPDEKHSAECEKVCLRLPQNNEFTVYLCPERRISFDGFVSYENRRFGIPYSYTNHTVRVQRNGKILRIYSSDLQTELVSYDVTWSKADRFCADQYANLNQPEEQPTAPVQTLVQMSLETSEIDAAFAKFDFSGGSGK